MVLGARSWIRSGPREQGGAPVAHEWTDDDAKASHDRAVTELVSVMTRLSQGGLVSADAAISAEVQRRDALMWASVEQGAPPA